MKGDGRRCVARWQGAELVLRGCLEVLPPKQKRSESWAVMILLLNTNENEWHANDHQCGDKTLFVVIRGLFGLDSF